MQPESSAKLDKSVSTVRRLASNLGCDVLDANYRLTNRSIRRLIAICIPYLIIVYSMWRIRHDPLLVLKVGLLIAKSIQLVSKLWNVVTRRHNYPVLLATLESVLKELQQNPSNEPILLKHMTRLNYWQSLLINAYRTAMVLAAISGIMLSVINAEFTLIFALYVPFVDEKTLLGYTLLTIGQMLYMKMATYIFPVFDSFFMILTLPIGAFVDAMDNEVQELNQLLNEEGSSNQNQIEDKLRRIYRSHQMLVNFETMVDDHYLGHNWFLLTFNMVGMVCCIFLAYAKNYFTGYAVLVAMLAQISQYCILGTYVATKNQRMVEIVYTINFYKLSASHQRMVSLMLQRAQNATEMSAGGIVPLNMETYVEILKGIYSYITILTTMVD